MKDKQSMTFLTRKMNIGNIINSTYCIMFYIFIFFSLLSCKEKNLLEEESIFIDDSYDYSLSPNYGKTLALFGGSFACIKESEHATSYWSECLGLEITNYAVGGAGFSSLSSSNNIQIQVNKACADLAPKYDIYLLWASTNDYWNVNSGIGYPKDYSNYDNYDKTKLKNQCGGINYCIKKIHEKNKDAKILFFTSIGRFDDLGKGTNPYHESETSMAKFVEAQKQCCINNNIPFLDQFNVMITEHNYKNYVQNDRIHLNKDGYDIIKHVQSLFIANH